MSAVSANASMALSNGAATAPASPMQRAWRRLRRRRAAMLGLFVVLGFIALALFAPWISGYDPVATDWGAIRKAPSAAHWFGTDEIGRDVFARVIWGTQASLLAVTNTTPCTTA